MMRHILLLLASFLCSCAFAQHLDKLINQAMTFDDRFPRETVYLHMDNAAYIQGDTLWYKAYVVRASTLRPDSTLSRTLYVELLNDAGSLLQRSILRLDSIGQAHGNFALTAPLQKGFYEIRAYTRAMTNWMAPLVDAEKGQSANEADEGYRGYYSHVFPLFELPKEALPGDFSQLDILRPESEADFKLPHERPYDFASSKDRRIAFFPEGGHLPEGTRAHVAFRLTDGKGAPSADSIAIFTAKGELICTAVPEHQGMGSFVLPKVEPGTYARAAGSLKKYPLPHPVATAIALHAYEEPDEETGTPMLNLDMQPTASMILTDEDGDEIPLRVAVVVFSGEFPRKVYPLELDRGLTTLAIDLGDFKPGVNRIEVVDAKGQPLASRLIFRQTPHDALPGVPQISVRQNAPTYEAFEPIAIEVEVKDEQGHPLPGTALSVSIRDERGDLVSPTDATLSTQLVLCSQLEGYVHQPDAYFAAQTRESMTKAGRRALDLLMQVQGWLPESMAQLCMKDTFNVRQPMEDFPIIRGRVIKDQDRLAPIPHAHLNMAMYNWQWHVLKAATTTDAEGVFALESHEDFVGDFTTQFNVTNKAGSDVWHRIMIDQWFGPKPKKYSPYEMQCETPSRPSPAPSPAGRGEDTTSVNGVSEDGASSPVSHREGQGGDLPDLFEWTDTIPRTLQGHTLSEAVVKGKKPFVFELIGKEFDRYNYGGGEAHSIRHSDTYFNVDLELQRIRDAGIDVFTIRDFLCFLIGDKDKALNPDPMIMGGAPDNLTTHAQSIESIAQQQSDANDELSQLSSDRADSSHDLGLLDKMAEYLEDEQSLPDSLTVKGRHFYVVYNNHAGIPLNQLNIQMPEQLKSVIVSYDAAWATRVWKMKHNNRNDHFDGLIYVHTRPDWYNYKQVKGVQKRTLHGFTTPDEFHGPDYRRTDPENDEDYRRTLYWNPRLTTDAEGKATAIFFANARWRQQLRISIRGITPDGKIIEYDR